MFIVENHLYPSDELSYLALVAATLGDTERAMRLANTAFEATDSMFEIGILAQVAVKLQDYDFVIKCIESATVRLEKLYDAQEIGMLVLDFFILMDILQTITDDASIIGESQRIVPYLHRMMHILEQLQFGSNCRTSSKEEVAAIFGKLGEFDTAMHFVTTVIHPHCQAGARVDIAIASLRFGQVDKMMAVFQTVLDAITEENASMKAWYLTKFARGLVVIGKVEKAKRYFEEALQSPGMNDWLLLSIVEEFVALGEQNRATQILEKAIQTENYSYDTLPQVTDMYVKLGQPEKVLHVIEKMVQRTEQEHDPVSRAAMLQSLAESYAELHDFDQTIQCLTQLNAIDPCQFIDCEEDFQEQAFVTIAQTYATQERWQDAYTIGKMVLNEHYKTKALATILSVWAEQHYPELKEVIIKSIPDERDLL